MPTATDNTAELWMKTSRLLKDRIFWNEGVKKMNPQQMFAMFMIHEHDGMTMRELAEFLGITSPSATSLVDRLVKLKWVVRMADPTNRKLVRVTLAPLGRTMLTSMMRGQERAMREVLSLLNVRDRSDFSRILANLHKALLSEKRS